MPTMRSIRAPAAAAAGGRSKLQPSIDEYNRMRRIRDGVAARRHGVSAPMNPHLNGRPLQQAVSTAQKPLPEKPLPPLPTGAGGPQAVPTQIPPRRGGVPQTVAAANAGPPPAAPPKPFELQERANRPLPPPPVPSKPFELQERANRPLPPTPPVRSNPTERPLPPTPMDQFDVNRPLPPTPVDQFNLDAPLPAPPAPPPPPALVPPAPTVQTPGSGRPTATLNDAIRPQAPTRSGSVSSLSTSGGSAGGGDAGGGVGGGSGGDAGGGGRSAGTSTTETQTDVAASALDGGRSKRKIGRGALALGTMGLSTLQSLGTDIIRAIDDDDDDSARPVVVSGAGSNPSQIIIHNNHRVDQTNYTPVRGSTSTPMYAYGDNAWTSII